MQDIFHNEKAFLRQWILASAIGLISGMWISWYTPRMALSAAQALEAFFTLLFPGSGVAEVIRTLPTYLVTTTHVGSVVIICLGLAQWWVLRRWVGWADRWRTAMVAGAIVSYLLMAAMNILAILLDPVSGLLKVLADSGVWIGVLTGVFQWVMLRKHVAGILWWIVMSMLIWIMGLAFVHYFGRPVINILGSLLRTFIHSLGVKGLGGVRFFTVGQILLWITGGVLGGVITGKVWIWVVNRTIPEK